MRTQLPSSQGAVVNPAVTITFPGGAVLGNGDPGVESALSEFLGQPVRGRVPAARRHTFDRAVPEQVLRDGIDALVRVETGQLGGASPGCMILTSRRFTADMDDLCATDRDCSPRGVQDDLNVQKIDRQHRRSGRSPGHRLDGASGKGDELQPDTP